jgi:regulator of protease activity HflC (stomatin/prohibitin superfamily)
MSKVKSNNIEDEIELTEVSSTRAGEPLLTRILPEDENKFGVLTIPDVTKAPIAVRDDDDDDDTLPLKEVSSVPEELVAHFSVVDRRQLVECMIKYGNTETNDIFNDLNQKMVRDDSNKVTNVREMVKKNNDYDYKVSGVPECCGYFVCCMLLGLYPYCCKRKVVDPDKLGHYVQNGQHRLLMPGDHTLVALNAKWVGENGQILKDDENNPIRRIGAKTHVYVRENCLGGAQKICRSDDKMRDGDYVLLNQGRHVLSEDEYQKIQIVNLNDTNNNIVKLGPVTILYVKEGYLGGAYHRTEGRYKIFLPGPPLLLHDKNYQDIVCVRRAFGGFDIGPVKIITVNDGQIGGAYHKASGLYQILTHGKSYRLHSKDYENATVVDMTDKFKLGPYYFVTVREGSVAGAYRVNGGRFVNFPPGSTYQCNEQDYREPICTKLNSNKVVCGPKTYLTVKKGTLCGAYRVDNGKFKEFEERDEIYVLHEKEYRDIVTVDKYCTTTQHFGPNKIVTIPDGFAGVVRKAGTLEILDVGFYKLASEYEVLESISLRTYTYAIKELEFNSKDSTSMKINANFVWKVTDASKVALYPGGFKKLSEDIGYQVNLTLSAKCSTFNREEILPTKQDVLLKHGEISEEEMIKLLNDADSTKNERHEGITQFSLAQLNSTSEISNWGIKICGLTIKGFILCDEQIKASFTEMTQSIISTNAEKVKSKLAIEQANTQREISIQATEAKASVSMKEAEARANVAKKEAESSAAVSVQKAKAQADANKQCLMAEAEVKVEVAKANAKVKEEEARADTNANKVRADADAQIRATKLEIENRERTEKAIAEAKAITAMADAEFYQKTKKNEAANKIPEHEIRLREMEICSAALVDTAKHYGKAIHENPKLVDAAISRVNEYFDTNVVSNMQNKINFINEHGNNVNIKTKHGKDGKMEVHAEQSF